MFHSWATYWTIKYLTPYITKWNKVGFEVDFEKTMDNILYKERYTNEEYFNHKYNDCNCALIKPIKLEQDENIDIMIKQVSILLLNYLYKDVINICTQYICEDYIKSCQDTPILLKNNDINNMYFFGNNAIPIILNSDNRFRYSKQNYYTLSLFISPEYTQEEKLILQSFTINSIVRHTELNLWYKIDGISKLFHFFRLKKPKYRLHNKIRGLRKLYITFKEAIEILELE